MNRHRLTPFDDGFAASAVYRRAAGETGIDEVTDTGGRASSRWGEWSAAGRDSG